MAIFNSYVKLPEGNLGKVEKSGEFVFLFDRLHFFLYFRSFRVWNPKIGGKNIPGKRPQTVWGEWEDNAL